MKITKEELIQIIKEELEYYYNDLGLRMDPTDDQKIIKKAYRKRAMKTHPDKGGNEEEFKKVNTAYTVLSDEEKKDQLDKALLSQALKTKKENPQAKFDGTTGMPLNDEIISIFKNMVVTQSDQSGSTQSTNAASAEQSADAWYQAQQDIFDKILKKINEFTQAGDFKSAQLYIGFGQKLWASNSHEDFQAKIRK